MSRTTPITVIPYPECGDTGEIPLRRDNLRPGNPESLLLGASGFRVRRLAPPRIDGACRYRRSSRQRSIGEGAGVILEPRPERFGGVEARARPLRLLDGGVVP
jgi:hypothetical protein